MLLAFLPRPFPASSEIFRAFEGSQEQEGRGQAGEEANEEAGGDHGIYGAATHVDQKHH